MSLDYPNRKDWLAVRCTSPIVIGRTIWDEGTFSDDRNESKRNARMAEKLQRATAIAARQDGDFTVNTAKIKRSSLMVDLLSDRRLRQRGLTA